MTYRINNREYGPSGLESHGALCEASCICMKDIFSKFDSSLCEKCQLKLSARAVGEIFVLHNVMISEFEYFQRKKWKLLVYKYHALSCLELSLLLQLYKNERTHFKQPKLESKPFQIFINQPTKFLIKCLPKIISLSSHNLCGRNHRLWFIVHT